MRGLSLLRQSTLQVYRLVCVGIVRAVHPFARVFRFVVRVAQGFIFLMQAGTVIHARAAFYMYRR